MSAEPADHKPPVADTAAMIERKRLEAELASINSQIRAFGQARDKLTAVGQDPVAFYRQLDARHGALQADLKSSAGAAQGTRQADLTQGVSVPVTIDAGWPLDYDLSQPTPPNISTYNGSYGFVQGQTTVQRTFEVGSGNVPAVAIVLGVAVGLPMQSELDLYFAGAGYSGLGFSSDGQPGRIAYSCAPIPVFE